MFRAYRFASFLRKTFLTVAYLVFPNQAPQARNYVAQRVSAGSAVVSCEAPEGRHVSHTFIKNHLHVVFSTKERRRNIAEDVQPHLWSYMAGICRNQKMVSLAIGGVEDHVHLLFHLPGTLTLSRAITLLKANSSKWMNEHGQDFAWQEGYGAFSVSASNLEKVGQYIRNQKEHHRHMTLENEFLTLLRKNRVEFDPQLYLGSVAPPGLAFFPCLTQRLRAGLHNSAPPALIY